MRMADEGAVVDRLAKWSDEEEEAEDQPRKEKVRKAKMTKKAVEMAEYQRSMIVKRTRREVDRVIEEKAKWRWMAVVDIVAFVVAQQQQQARAQEEEQEEVKVMEESAIMVTRTLPIEWKMVIAVS